MPRPLKVDRPSKVHIYFPESVMARLRLELYSELEARVPHGAISQFVVEAVREKLDREAGAGAQK